MLRRIPLWLLGAAAAALVTLYQLPFWFLFVFRRIGYAYPIDYGEGPLLRQLQYVLHGGSLAGVYGDLQAAPMVVANYPPLFLAVSHLFALVLAPLTAGRVVSAVAGLGVGYALWLLAQPVHPRSRAVALAAALTATRW